MTETMALEAQKNTISIVLLRGGMMKGQTRKQMLDATAGAIYIWPLEKSMFYAIELASALGRDDLKIIPLSNLNRIDRFQGIDIVGVALDHACFGRISDTQLRTLDLIKSRVARLRV